MEMQHEGWLDYKHGFDFVEKMTNNPKEDVASAPTKYRSNTVQKILILKVATHRSLSY
jgi:hypothetical protein